MLSSKIKNVVICSYKIILKKKCFGENQLPKRIKHYSFLFFDGVVP